MSAPHTPGPWRWEISIKSKRLHLVGGRQKYDLTIIDFERWGMSQATIRLRDTAHDGMNLMHKLHERPDWIEPFPGREHHKEWCSNVIHPDARRIVACVNACEGLDTELLEASQGKMFHTLRMIERLGAERDQLLAAAERVCQAENLTEAKLAVRVLNTVAVNIKGGDA